MTEPSQITRVVELAMASHMLSRGVHVIADFGVADALGDTPETAATLAQRVGVHADPLARIMRLLAAYGVFEAVGDAFRHTELSRILRSDHPQSQRGYARLCGSWFSRGSIDALDYTLRTGKAGVTKLSPDGVFPYLAQHPEEAQIFDEAMTSKSSFDIATILQAYDFSDSGRIADIGGGRGHLIKAIVEAFPRVTGVLSDQAHVLHSASHLASSRLTLHPANFFEDALPAADTYILMNVIHDWEDEQALQIFRAVRKAGKPGAKLLLIESPLPDKPEPTLVAWLDIAMLQVVGGRERTYGQYRALLEASGFTPGRRIATGKDIEIMMAVINS